MTNLRIPGVLVAVAATAGLLVQQRARRTAVPPKPKTYSSQRPTRAKRS